MKILARILIGVLILMLIGIIGAFVYIDSIAEAAVERGATDALGVTTSLDSADVGVFGGTFAMNGLRVDNPSGFGERPFLHLQEGDVAVSLGTLRKETIELPYLRLEGLDMDIERREGKSNYSVILTNVKGDREPAPEDASSKKFVIREVSIRDVKVRVAMAPLGGDPTVVNIPIAEIKLKDVGADRPLPLSQVAGVIVQAVFATVIEEGGALLPTDLLNDLGGALSQLGNLEDFGISVVTDLGEQAEKLLQGVGKVGEEAGKAASEIGKTIEGIGRDLFKKKEEGGGGQ